MTVPGPQTNLAAGSHDPNLGIVLGGRYRLQSRIGHGGMSSVYRAFDTVLERSVAVKLMHREIASDSDQLQRFRREARSIARLNHPHIVTVVDAGEQDPREIAGGGGAAASLAADQVATPYIVLELVEGETLKALIARSGPLEISTAIAYAIEVARALGAAHGQGMIHRDVKPQNILIDSDFGAKITDFGIARMLTDQSMTMDGRVLGTTDYISPEQALGERLTGQSDIYSLGIVLFEMLTGSVPFRADSPVSVAMKHVREQIPDVQRLRPQVSAATAAVLERATAKDLSRRYLDVASLESDLAEVLAIEAARSGETGGEVTTIMRTLPRDTRRRIPWQLRHRYRWLGALLAAIAVCALALAAAAGSTHRGTGVVASVPTVTGLAPVALAQTAAHDYNPFGTGPENRDQIGNVVDNEPNTIWSTEQYFDYSLDKAGGTGTGVYLDAAPKVLAKALEVQTRTPGFAAEVYVANRIEQLPYGDSEPLSARGWVGPVGRDRSVTDHARIKLALRGRPYRYYLLWITTLPRGALSVSLAELTLLR